MKISVGSLGHGGPRETEALARFRAAHARGVRMWRCQDGEILEVVAVPELRGGVPVIEVRAEDGKIYGYTMHSSGNWQPVEPA